MCAAEASAQHQLLAPSPHARRRRTPPHTTNKIAPTTASALDLNEPQSGIVRSEFRGFYVALWIMVLSTLGSAMVENYRARKTIIPTWLFFVFTRDLDVIVPIFLAFLLYSFTAFLLVKAMALGLVDPRGWTVLCLQHALQTCLFVLGVFVCWRGKWPVVQTGSFVTELIVLFMKMHSYTEVQRARATATAGKSAERAHWVATVTVGSYIDYLLVPSMVFRPNFPRTKSVRIMYLAHKTVLCVATLSIAYVVVMTSIVPTLREITTIPPVLAVLRLSAPFMLMYHVFFFVMFEVVCNAFAELTCYADRRFYDAWWNASSFEEYARMWNRPVHCWLAHHVYAPLHARGWSKPAAMFTTFAFSGIMHELIMVCMFRSITPWVIVFVMLQVPLIALGRTRFMREHKGIGNVLVWVGLCLGPAIMGVLYARVFCRTNACFTDVKLE